jgi:hypothetical protein
MRRSRYPDLLGFTLTERANSGRLRPYRDIQTLVAQPTATPTISPITSHALMR